MADPQEGKNKEGARLLRSIAPVEQTKVVLYAPEEVKPRKISKQEMQLFELAEQLGYQIIDRGKLIKYLADSIASRMTPRVGDNVYQMPSFSIPNFPLSLATLLFPSSCLTAESGTTKTWVLNAFTELTAVFDPMLLEYVSASKMMMGITRALKKPSEPWVRVMATLYYVEVTFAVKDTIDMLYVDFSYVLTEEAGDVHAPKDANRVEVQIPDARMAELRAQTLADALNMVVPWRGKEYPLSAGWFNQLGMHERAMVVLCQEENFESVSSFAPPLQPGEKRKRKPKAVQELFNVSRIVEAETRGGRRGYWVEWEGYRPSWEVHRVGGRGAPGEPLVTWEPAATMKDTIALQEWQAQE